MVLNPTTVRQKIIRSWPYRNLARNMSTFNHSRLGVPVTLPEGLSEEQVLKFHPFQVSAGNSMLELRSLAANQTAGPQSWITTLQNSLELQSQNASHPFHSDPYVLRSVTVQAYDLFGKRVGFLKLTSKVSNGADEWLPGAVFLRGPSVAMLVTLVPDDVPADTDERYVLLTVQPRIAAGSLEFVELPAGMVDEAGNFGGTAANEIQEELGLEIPVGELTSLSDLAAGISGGSFGDEGAALRDGNLPRGVFPSPGACDEYIPIYAHERRIPRSQLGEWTGRLTGLRDHGEKITLKLVRMQDLWKEAARDGKTLAALALWEGLRREGKI